MSPEDLYDLIDQKIEGLRPRLLDLSRRNPLVASKLTPRSNSHVRVVDELPDELFYNLCNNQLMRFVALPPLGDDPKDEETDIFRETLVNARLTDLAYQSATEALDHDAEDYLDQARAVERNLKDRVRNSLGLPDRPEQRDVNLVQHARNNGISPSYELPQPESKDERHADDDIQTLLLPKDLERKLSSLGSKCSTWIQETGINVLHGAFGFLEWAELNSSEFSMAPLVLLQVKLEKKKTKDGLEFRVSGLGEEPETNTVLSEKLRIEFGIHLPVFPGGSIEKYLREVSALSPKTIRWRVKRQVVFGVFPSARMAMYHDLNTLNAEFHSNEIINPIFGGSASIGSSPFADEYLIDSPDIERKVPFLVLDADSSQFSTLVDVAEGKNVAVEGPPGTGKSQTIVNAIASAVATGKKVLFVAEKMAALNVVRSRLEAIGLGDFILPLQAERSTREAVIQSIRDRLEMGSPLVNRHYDRQVAQFRAARDETASYIRILSETFEDSGLTVHEIVGKSIATGGRLDNFSKALQLSQFPISAGLTAENISEFSQRGRAIELAWQNASGVSPVWTGITIQALNRFDIEELLEAATALLKCTTLIHSNFITLDRLGLADLENSADLPQLISIFERAAETDDSSYLHLLPEIIKSNAVSALQSFLEGCLQFAQAETELRSFIRQEIVASTLDALAELEKLCAQNEIDNLDIEALSRGLAAKRQTISVARRLASQMQPFADQNIGSEDWDFSDIPKMRALITRASRAILQARNAKFADLSTIALLKEHNAAGRRLLQEQESLAAHFTFAESVDAESLSNCAVRLRNGGVFRFIKPSYRRAIKEYLRIAKSTFNRIDAIRSLEQLASWKRREADFKEEQQASALYGNHFRGLHTNFGFFERVVDFYESVDQSFASSDRKSIREFLLTCDTEALLALPILDAYPDGVRLGAITGGIDRLEREAENRHRVCARLQDLVQIFQEPARIELRELPDLRAKVTQLLTHKDSLDRRQDVATSLGPNFKGAETDTNLLNRLALIAAPIARLTAGHHDVALVIVNDQAQAAFKAVTQIQQARTEAQRIASGLRGKAGLPANSVLLTGPLSSRVVALEEASKDADGLLAHSEFASAKNAIDPLLVNLVDNCVTEKGTCADLGGILEALAYRALVRRVFEKHGAILSKFSGTKLNELRRTVADLDRQIIESARGVLNSKIKLGANPPRGNGVGKKSSWTEMALIENETSKKQRFIPVRDLTRRAGKALLELKPCWMMSPLAVAQYLPKGELTFDLCIIDEASQMPPEDSIGALGRSRSAMIVGDTNQLPPSSFFRKMIDDDDADEDETILNESILEMANATFRPARRLRWHYRSRHSGLIKFSNRTVYNDDLVVFPSATETMPGMGVEFRAVSGLYKSGTNPIEAREMVEAAIRFMRDDPNRSLGIVTLNQKQRELIFEEMEHALSRDATAARYVEDWAERNDGLEEFFIKNLENVQGDERDVIFIGTVYGPEERGSRVMQRFGPINGLAGKRRLNVLFTRAKQLIVTFSSMTAGDITAEAQGNEGAYMLKRWLEYSSTGMLDAGELTQKEPDSDFEIFVMNQIRAMGCTPVPQVGVRGYSIDIGVQHPLWPHGFILGVECDGAAFHSSKSARDRDRLRQQVLEGLGWRFHRIWSTDWFNNPGKQAEILRSVITARLAELRAKEADFVRSPASRSDERSETKTTVEDIARDKPSATATILEDKPQKGRVSIGDTVRVRYLTDDKKVVQFTISKERSDPASGLVYFRKPIAEALLGAEEGDEVEILVGSYLRSAILEKIVTRIY